MKLTNDQWQFIAPVIPEASIELGRRGRPRTDARRVLEGILWIAKTGARWCDLPKDYPSYQTCHRWFQRWVKENVMFRVVEKLVMHLKDKGKIDLTETFIDATYVDAQKGGLELVKPSGEMAPRSWRSQTLTLFLSPYMLRVVHHMRVNSLRKLYGESMLMTFLSDLSETRLTILINSIPDFFQSTELSSLLPIGKIEKNQLRMGDLLDDTESDGLSSDFSLGFFPIEVPRFDTR